MEQRRGNSETADKMANKRRFTQRRVNTDTDEQLKKGRQTRETGKRNRLLETLNPVNESIGTKTTGRNTWQHTRSPTNRKESGLYLFLTLHGEDKGGKG